MCALLLAGPLHAQTHLVIVTGLGGDPRYSAEFTARARTLAAAAVRAGVDSSRIAHFGERTTPRATRDTVLAAVHALAARAERQATVVLVLIGHGSASGAPAFNIAGPDLTAADLAGALGAFTTQRVVVVNAASASGPWVAALSAPGRVVVTATRSAAEREQPVFGRFLVDALAADVADADHNGRVSVLEAFAYARREVERFYNDAGRLRSERALLDDNGDGQGSMEPGGAGEANADGALAGTVFLAPVTAGARDPAVAALLLRQDSLERVVADLRARRAAVDSATYQRELEAVLLEIARVGRELRARQATP